MPNYILREVEKLADDLGIDRKRSIGEVAKELKVKTGIPEKRIGKKFLFYYFC